MCSICPATAVVRISSVAGQTFYTFDTCRRNVERARMRLALLQSIWTSLEYCDPCVDLPPLHL
jgi:hypothetical protein